MQSSLFGLAASFCAYPDAVISLTYAWLAIGQGAAGVGVVALRFITKTLIASSHAAVSTMIFFVIGFLWVMLSILVFIAFLHQNRTNTTLVVNDNNLCQNESGGGLKSDYIRIEESREENDSNEGVLASVTVLSVLRQIWPQTLSVFLVFTTCISCFRG